MYIFHADDGMIRWGQDMELKNVLNWIAEAEEHELTFVAEAMMKRDKKLHPDWEFMYIAFPLKQEDLCREILDYAWVLLKKSIESREGEAKGMAESLAEAGG